MKKIDHLRPKLKVVSKQIFARRKRDYKGLPPVIPRPPNSRAKTILKAALDWVVPQITLNKVLLLVTSIAAILYLAMDARKAVIVLDPIALPKEFSDAGITSEVMAERIREELTEMERSAAKSSMLIESAKAAEETLPDIEIPATKLSLRTAEDSLRRLFRTEAQHLSTDITYPPSSNDAKVRCRLVKGDEVLRSANEQNLEWGTEDISTKAEKIAATLALEIAELKDPLLAGLYLDKQGRLPEGKQVADQMLNTWPDTDHLHAKAYILKAYIIQDMKDGQDSDKRAIETAQKAIDLDPQYAFAWHSAGYVYLNSNPPRLDKAEASYRRAIALDRKMRMAHNNLGEVLRRENNLDEAAREYLLAVQLDPKFAFPHNNLGLVLQDQHKLDEAAAEYRLAIQLDPKYSHPHNGLGNVLWEEHKADEAAAEYRLAIQLDPKDAHPHNGLGIVLSNERRLDEAAAEYRLAIQLDPKIPGPHNGLGNVLLEEHKLDNAAAEYRLAIQLDPKSAYPHRNLGIVLWEQNKLDEAAAEFRLAIQVDPKDANPHNSLGIVLREQNKLDEATAEYRLAIQLDSKFALAHRNLALLLRQQGKTNLADQESQLAHQLDPSHY